MDHLATDNELVRNILLALLSSLAKLEAQKISDRTKAGMARAKANGIKIGRPKLEIEIRQKIMQRAKKGETPRPRSEWEGGSGFPPIICIIRSRSRLRFCPALRLQPEHWFEATNSR
jgi:hypothetical protein